jgi:hypothetical protein
MDAELIVKSLTSLTSKWTKQCKAEERHANAVLRREAALTAAGRVTVIDAAYEVMPDAYDRASTGNTLPAHARQIMYAGRDEIQERTGEPLNDKYFTQTLLPDYLRSFPEETKDWDVVFDARGHAFEPHGGKGIPLGTIEVRNYLQELAEATRGGCGGVRLHVETGSWCGPGLRFGAVLYVEKEGFLPLFRAVRLADRFDLCLMSTKGVSVTASRSLVEAFCLKYGMRLFVLRDFDRAGFTTLGTFTRNNRRYSYKKPMGVTDLGLKLAHARDWGLKPEKVVYRKLKKHPGDNLIANGATPEEIAFLVSGTEHDNYVGRRYELNAFSSGRLVEYIEKRLTEEGVGKVVPASKMLDDCYRLELEALLIRQYAQEVGARLKAEAQATPLPPDLERAVRDALARKPALAWYEAVRDIAASHPRFAALGQPRRDDRPTRQELKAERFLEGRGVGPD